jgi:UDP-N-acetylglucosamine 4-epimerase
VYNIAVGESTSLNQLFSILRDLLAEQRSELRGVQPAHRPFREGDVRHSLADIRQARELLDYRPTHTLASGLREALPWYVGRFAGSAAVAG